MWTNEAQKTAYYAHYKQIPEFTKIVSVFCMITLVDNLGWSKNKVGVAAAFYKHIKQGYNLEDFCQEIFSLSDLFIMSLIV